MTDWGNVTMPDKEDLKKEKSNIEKLLNDEFTKNDQVTVRDALDNIDDKFADYLTLAVDQGYLTKDQASQRNFDRETAIEELGLYYENNINVLLKAYLKK